MRKFGSTICLLAALLLGPDFISGNQVNLNLALHEEIGDSVGPAPYAIIKNTKDNTLKGNEGKFTFYFRENVLNSVVKQSLKMSYNGKEITTTKNEKGSYSIILKPGKYKFQFYYATNYQEIYTDSIKLESGFHKEIAVTFQSTLIMETADKPVIYVYPKEKTEVSIKLDLTGKLNFTYPEYKIGWNFTADSTGTISINDKKYNYLFWEGNIAFNENDRNAKKGFLVKKENLISFFEEKLSAMGLNSKEQADFITYWVPRMGANESNFVHFIFNEEFNEYAK
ncbi:MAG: hypothetical protein IAF38_14445, partial [Bacteroidia bacterium]|nr:hypothetical protein [Bacteroidia bacterium]